MFNDILNTDLIMYFFQCLTLCDGLSDRSFMVDPLSSTIGVTKAVVCGILSVG